MIGVYVAGASANKERARAFMARVREHSLMRLTRDWVQDVDAATVPEDELTDEQRLKFATTNLVAISHANVVVALLEEDWRSDGMLFELGYATCIRGNRVIIGNRIIVSGGGRKCIFAVPGLVDAEFYDAGLRHPNLANGTPVVDAAAFARLVQCAEDTIYTYPDDFER